MDEKTVVNNLLIKTGHIIDKHETTARETGSSFNIFNIARIERKELIVSRVLAELLNPQGRHGQGIAYLKLFMSDCLSAAGTFSDEDLSGLCVVTERFTDKGRPIDIAIEGTNRFIPIEVKIDAVDQSRQCYDYWKYAQTKDKSPKIVYLTLFGHMPTKDSRGELDEKDIIPLSFDRHILGWLGKCLALPDTIRKAPIREILIQFISATKDITNQLEDKPLNEMHQLLFASEQNMRHSIRIAEVLNGCRNMSAEMTVKFFDAFRDRFQSTYAYDRFYTESDYDKQPKEYPSIHYKIADLEEGISLLFAMETNKRTHLLVGFTFAKNGTRSANREAVKTIRNCLDDIDGLDEQAEWGFYIEVRFDNEKIYLLEPPGNNCANYFRLFNPDMFNELVDSTFRHAKAIIGKLKQPYSNI